MNKKLIRQTAVLIAITAGLIIIISALTYRRRPSMEEEIIERAPVYLNKTLTNEISEIDQMSKMDDRIKKYMRKWHIKGASLAISRNDSLIYAKGYGWADEQNQIKMSPGHIMRIASVSKLITAAGIMVLQEREMLSLRDTVFGPSGILNDSTYTSWIKDRHTYDITVEHLLRHQGGFRRDPLFSSRDVMHLMKLDQPPTHEDYIQITLQSRLRFKPGEWQKYSNIGYLLLSKIIERKSGMRYEDFIRKEVLEPAGCYDFHLANNYYEEKFPNEVRYYTHEGDGKFIEEYDGSGRIVERCYGGNDIHSLSGAGAWVASPAEISRFVSSINNYDNVPEILSKDSILEMTTYFGPDVYSLGWNDTKEDGTWTRTGTLAGTSALVKCYPDGECWILVTNTSTWKGPGFTNYTSKLFDQCRKEYSALLPSRDLFEGPVTN